MKGNKLGNVISELRKAKGLKQSELADEIGISDKSISRWENGKSYPNIDMIFQLSKYFKVSFYNLLEARMEDDNSDDELVKEIVKEFHDIKHRNKRRIKILLLITLIITVILTIAMIFTNTYNRFKVYQVEFYSDEFYPVNGFYVETKIKDTLYLSNLKIKNINTEVANNVSVDVYYKENDKEYILQSYSRLDRINFSSFQSYIEIGSLKDYLNNLFLKVTVVDKDNNILTYDTQLKFTLDFSNNKIYYNDNSPETINLMSKGINNIKDILIANGFEEFDDMLIRKNNKKYTINYNILLNKVSINYEKNKFNYRLVYNLITNILEVNVFDKNNIEIENYSYDVLNNKVINCNIGKCNNYDEVLNVLNKNFLNLIN